MSDINLKKSTKKWIYIVVGLTAFILIAAGVGFWLWSKSKSSNNKSDSADEEDEDINEEEIPPEIKEHRKKDWTNRKTGLWDYEIPSKQLPTNISVSRAKDELLEALHHWWGKDEKWDKKKIEKALNKNAQRINLADKKGNEDDPLFETKFGEILAEKYRQNIFSSLPKQKEFKKSCDEAIGNLHFLRKSFDLKYKSNKKIDWVASLQKHIKSKVKNKTKTQQEEDLAKMTNYLEREYNPFVGLHINKFPNLTNLKELNEWTHILVKKGFIANRIVFKRFYLGERMSKNLLSPVRGGWEKVKYASLKNEKFGLEPVASAFKA